MTSNPPPGLASPAAQLWCVRDQLRVDPHRTIATLADYGYSAVEPFTPSAFPGLAEALVASGVTTTSVHEHVIGVDLEAAFSGVRSLGGSQIIESWTEPELWRDRDSVLRLAEAINASVDMARSYGLAVGYHNHDHEFRSRIDGAPAFYTFADALAPEVVLQIDLNAVAEGQAATRDVWSRYGSRVESVHVLGQPRAIEALRGELDDLCFTSSVVAGLLEILPQARVIVELVDGDPDRLADAREALRDLWARTMTASL